MTGVWMIFSLYGSLFQSLKINNGTTQDSVGNSVSSCNSLCSEMMHRWQREPIISFSQYSSVPTELAKSNAWHTMSNKNDVQNIPNLQNVDILRPFLKETDREYQHFSKSDDVSTDLHTKQYFVWLTFTHFKPFTSILSISCASLCSLLDSSKSSQKPLVAHFSHGANSVGHFSICPIPIRILGKPTLPDLFACALAPTWL